VAADRGLDTRNIATADKSLDITLQSGNPLVDEVPGQRFQDNRPKTLLADQSHPGKYIFLHQPYATLTSGVRMVVRISLKNSRIRDFCAQKSA
jgi:hypothetical protein